MRCYTANFYKASGIKASKVYYIPRFLKTKIAKENKITELQINTFPPLLHAKIFIIKFLNPSRRSLKFKLNNRLLFNNFIAKIYKGNNKL